MTCRPSARTVNTAVLKPAPRLPISGPVAVIALAVGLPIITAGRRAFFLTFSITQRDARPAVTGLVSLVGEVPVDVAAIGAAVVTRSRQTRRALCGMSGKSVELRRWPTYGGRDWPTWR